MFSCQQTVSAIAYSIIRERCAVSDRAFHNNRVARFVYDQLHRMPDYLGLAMRMLTVCFELSSLIWAGRRFHLLPHAQRWRQVQRWQNARFGPCRDFVRFYTSLVVFGWYAEEYGRANA